MSRSLPVRRRDISPLAVPPALMAYCAAAAIGTLGMIGVAQAAGLGLKPGLWDVRLVRQTVDGSDVSAQLTESVAKTQTALAKLPLNVRTRAEQRFQADHDSGSNTSFRICLTAAMAASDLPVMDKDGTCRPVMLSRSNHDVTFRIQCSVNGTLVKGRGEAVNSGRLIIAKSDVVTHATGGSTHRLHNETQMHYLGADCEKPLSPAQPGAASYNQLRR
ncbi:MAG TPA: DUF3617 family protein [Steroidobacteraceae bacterium]|nr:DUF3617 family protein [Steroidobacteraceae bacterium]